MNQTVEGIVQAIRKDPDYLARYLILADAVEDTGKDKAANILRAMVSDQSVSTTSAAEEDFLTLLRLMPENERLRNAWADQVEKQGEKERAIAIRREMEPPPARSRHIWQHNRLQAIHQRLSKAVKNLPFERMMPEDSTSVPNIFTHLDEFDNHATTFARYGLRNAAVIIGYQNRIETLSPDFFQKEELRYFTGLTFQRFNSQQPGLSTQDLEALAASPNLRNLQYLDLQGSFTADYSVNPEPILAFAQTLDLPQVRAIRLPEEFVLQLNDGNYEIVQAMNNSIVAAFAKNPNLPKLETVFAEGDVAAMREFLKANPKHNFAPSGGEFGAQGGEGPEGQTTVQELRASRGQQARENGMWQMP